MPSCGGEEGRRRPTSIQHGAVHGHAAEKARDPNRRKGRAEGGQASRRQTPVSQSAAAIEWTFVDDPDAWAASVRDRVEGARMSLGTARTAAEVEAFAQALRERAEPPPPIDPRQ